MFSACKETETVLEKKKHVLKLYNIARYFDIHLSAEEDVGNKFCLFHSVDAGFRGKELQMTCNCTGLTRFGASVPVCVCVCVCHKVKISQMLF